MITKETLENFISKNAKAYAKPVDRQEIVRFNYHEGANSIAPVVLLLAEALEDCTGGDMASDGGIYKAEIARKALAKAEEMLGGKDE